MAAQPTGQVTLLFTDIEGSTRLLERLGPERYRDALELHRRVLREAFERHAGYEVDSEGDAFFVFPLEGLASAVARVGESVQAARMLGAAAALREPLDLHDEEVERRVKEETMRSLRSVLGDDGYERALTDGAAGPFDDLVAEALRWAREHAP
jgi:class 3 adenylate cyclase